MKNSLVVFIFFFFSSFSFSQKVAPLREEVTVPFSSKDVVNFKNPSKINYPETWFHFIDGNVEEEGITKDLEAIAKAGFSGVQFFHGGNFGGSWPGVQDHIYCLSDKWEDILSYTASESKRLGLRFTMQNCPGWSMAGGPWIEPENAMRVLSWTRTELKGGEYRECKLDISAQVADTDSDYRDIAVLAFKRPLDDFDSPVEPLCVTSDTLQKELTEILSGRKDAKNIVFPSNHPISFTVEFPEDTILRTLVMNTATYFNYNYCYEPSVNVKVEACIDDEGQTRTLLDTPFPACAWSMYRGTMTFSLNEVKTNKIVITLDHSYEFKMNQMYFMTSARKNSWEAEAGWNLVRIPYESEYPAQDVQSFVKYDDIIDLSSFVDNEGILKWNAPEGDWIVLRIGDVNSKRRNGPAPLEATGWECNKLSAEGADIQFDNYVGKYYSSLIHGNLNGLLLDSWECGPQTWTSLMEEQFQQLTGYELRRWLPALFGYVINDQRTTYKFLRDWRFVINHLTVENFYGEMAKKAKEKGLSIQYETSGGDVSPIDIMEYYKYADVPMAEFWNHSTSKNYVGSINFKPVRPAASAGHLYGKTRISAEAFTSFYLTWNEHLSLLKENANRHLCDGITHLVFHTYTHNPKADSLFPGTSFGSSIGTPFLRGQTWWKYMPSFTKFLARCTYMLERGKPVSDVLWYLGDDINHKPDQRISFIDGYKYDYCNRDVLLNYLDVCDGELVTPEGLSYRVLWYPDASSITAETLSKLLDLVERGAILVTDIPKESASLISYDKDKFLSDWTALYGCDTVFCGCDTVLQVGDGKVYIGKEISDVLAMEEIESDVKTDSICWCHRQIEGADWYFVAPPEGSGYDGTIELRSVGKSEIWNPVSGEIYDAQSVRVGDRTQVKLHMKRGESFFILFDHSKPEVKTKNPLILSTKDFSRDWTLRFPSGWGMPEEIKIDKLLPWKDMNVSAEGKSFSGTATYHKEIYLANFSYNRRYTLSLGNVDQIAVVRVNGKRFDPLWSEPYALDITSALDSGKNIIEIDVTSGWYNRLIYDAGLTDSSSRKTWTLSGPSADAEFVPTGLLGPVTLKESR